MSEDKSAARELIERRLARAEQIVAACPDPVEREATLEGLRHFAAEVIASLDAGDVDRAERFLAEADREAARRLVREEVARGVEKGHEEDREWRREGHRAGGAKGARARAAPSDAKLADFERRAQAEPDATDKAREIDMASAALRDKLGRDPNADELEAERRALHECLNRARKRRGDAL